MVRKNSAGPVIVAAMNEAQKDRFAERSTSKRGPRKKQQQSALVVSTIAPFAKRRNKISGQFSPRLVEMLESPAYRALSLSAHLVLARIEIELAHHGGNDNGQLIVTYDDFVAYGVHRHAIGPAIRELEALGFIRVTQRGRGGNAEYRRPILFLLTFAHDRHSRQAPPSHDWRKIETLEEAHSIARAARRVAQMHPKKTETQ